MRESGGVWIAESAIQRVRSAALLEPLQQRLSLRMVGKRLGAVFDWDGDGTILKYFHGITRFQVVLAGAGPTGEHPCRHGIVQERIVEGFRNFMAERGHIFKPGAEKSR